MFRVLFSRPGRSVYAGEGCFGLAFGVEGLGIRITKQRQRQQQQQLILEFTNRCASAFFLPSAGCTQVQGRHPTGTAHRRQAETGVLDNRAFHILLVACHCNALGCIIPHQYWASGVVSASVKISSDTFQPPHSIFFSESVVQPDVETLGLFSFAHDEIVEHPT